MGSSKSKSVENALPEMLKKKVIELFKLMDKDDSNSIEKKEAKEFWKKNFSQVNTIALFEQVDVNGDGSIELGEWLQHWMDVYKTGKYTEEYLINEVLFILYVLKKFFPSFLLINHLFENYHSCYHYLKLKFFKILNIKSFEIFFSLG